MYPTQRNGCEDDEATEFSDKLNASVVLEALHRDKTMQEIVARCQLRPKQVSTWKQQATSMAIAFSDKSQKPELKELHPKIGQLISSNFEKNLNRLAVPQSSCFVIHPV